MKFFVKENKSKISGLHIIFHKILEGQYLRYIFNYSINTPCRKFRNINHLNSSNHRKFPLTFWYLPCKLSLVYVVCMCVYAHNHINTYVCRITINQPLNIFRSFFIDNIVETLFMSRNILLKYHFDELSIFYFV